MGASGRTDLFTTIDTAGRTKDRRDDFAEVYGDWDEVGARIEPGRGRRPSAPGAAWRSGAALRPRCWRRCAARSATRPGSRDAEALALLDADGAELDALAALADGLRRDAAGDDVTYVVTRNINFTNVCYTGCRFCAFAQRRTDADAYTLSLEQVGDRAEEAWEAGATEVCMQGGIHPDLPGTAYFDIAAEVKRRCPDMHVHAFSPMEVMNGASRTGLPVREWLIRAREAGVDSLPGTAAEILDDDVRWVLTKGKLPAAAWIEVITTAHELGIRTTATMMYGHVDTPAHWVGHLRVIRGIQERTGGFTEFVLLPFVHASSPIYLAGNGPARADPAGEPGRARAVPDHAARRDRQHPVLLGQARRRRLPGGARRRRQRPGRHADGGDHQPDGRLAERLLQDHQPARRRWSRRPGGRCGSGPRCTARRRRSGWPRRPPATACARPSAARRTALPLAAGELTQSGAEVAVRLAGEQRSGEGAPHDLALLVAARRSSPSDR